MSGRQVRQMRSLMRVLMGVVFAALVLAAGSVLVVRTETAGDSLPAQLPTPVLAQSAAPADEATPVLRSERHEEHAAASRADDTDCMVACIQDADGNGWPVTASTWRRAVYSVCPPEGMFG